MNEFQDKIERMRQNRPKEMRGDFMRRDTILSRFQSAYKPLIDHVQDLARTHFPDRTKMDVLLELSDNFTANLTFTISKENDSTVPGFGDYEDIKLSHWDRISTLRFYNHAFQNGKDPAAPKPPGLLARIFKRNTQNEPDMKPYRMSCNDFSGPYQRAVLDPAKMDAAKTLIEDWMARHLAYDFDKDALYPTASVDVTITRKDPPKPDHKPGNP